MVVTMCIIEAKNPSVVPAIDGMVDVRQVVAGHNGLSAFLISPNLIAQQSPAGFWLQFEALLFEQGFLGQFDHEM